MRVAYVSVNRESLPDAVIPIGLLYLMAATPDRHEKLLLDLCFEAEPLAFLAAGLAGFQPDVVAIGIRNLQNMDYTNMSANLDFCRRVVATVRANSTARIVLGGAGFSVMPDALMMDLSADYGIPGEGEHTFPLLLEAIESAESDFAHVGSLRYWGDGRLIGNPRSQHFLRLDEVAPPYRSLLDSRYYSDFGTDSVQTKRGCPFRCEYCTYPLIEGRRSRLRDPRAVALEFDTVSSSEDVRHIFIVDSVFNVPAHHAKAVCRELEAIGNRTPWTSYISPVSFDEELAELMQRAGATGMEIGSDSGCDEVLDSLRKGFRTDKILRLARIAKVHGLKDCHSFILGTSRENLDQVERTMNFIEDLDPYAAVLLVWVDDAEIVDSDLARSRQRFRDEIYERVRTRLTNNPRWIVPKLGANFDRDRFARLRRLGLRGPLWQHLDRSSPNRESL
jgi:radical SAM superfamily enzyme YgiQ (UPF0313 family)